MHLNSIIILPAELIVNILKYTDYKTVIACRRSCHQLKEIVDASSALQYIVELAGAGMRDGAPNGAVPAVRLRGLREMQNAWKCPAWSTVDHFPTSKGISPYPMTASGNLVVFRSCRSRRGEFVLLRLPSESRGIPERLWSLDVGTNQIETACADDSQDLLIFTCSSTVHIRTLSTGGVHPLTSTAGSIHSESIAGGFKLLIHEDLLLVLGNNPGVNSLVWSWKTGELVAEIPLTTSCLSFLDRNHVVSIHYNGTQERGISFQVTTLPDVAGEPPSHVYHFMLNLPIGFPPYFAPLQANTLPTNWSDSDNPGWFHADPKGRVLAFTLGLPIAGGLVVEFTQHTLFVPHNVFLSHIATHSQIPNPLTPSKSTDPPDGASASTPIVVPWDAWGPGHTRLTTLPYVCQLNTGLYKACGMHALGTPHVLRDRGVLRITDYHPHRVARARARSCAPPGDDGPRCGNDGDDDGESNDDDYEDDGPSDEAWRRRRERANYARDALLRSTQIPYVEKDIPLPDGLGHVQCVLGEDVVLLIQFSFGDPENPAHKIEKIDYHPI